MKPLFPFGYGLSYTTFKYTNLKADEHGVSFEVSNTGSRAGGETVQLYIRLRGTSVAQPVRALKGLQRVTLSPGETKKVSFTLPAEAFAIWNDRNQFAAEPAKVSLWISPDSSKGSAAELEIGP